MRKLSKINEGMFDNGIKRAHTKEVRIEDDVNLMNMKEFYQYLQNLYHRKNEIFNGIHIGSDRKSICLPVIVLNEITSYYLDLMYDNDKLVLINIPGEIKNTHSYIFDILRNNLSIAGDNPIMVYPKDNSKLSNKFAIEVIDTILDNLKGEAKKLIVLRKNVNEGMFDNGIKRTHTKEVRTEDNVDMLDYDGMYEYIKNHYSLDPDINNKIIQGSSRMYEDIWIPCCYYKNEVFNFFLRYNRSKPDYVSYVLIHKSIIHDYDLLDYNKLENFCCVEHDYNIEHDDPGDPYLITLFGSKLKEFKNTNILEIIDFICDNVKNPCIKKRTS